MCRRAPREATRRRRSASSNSLTSGARASSRGTPQRGREAKSSSTFSSRRSVTLRSRSTSRKPTSLGCRSSSVLPERPMRAVRPILCRYSSMRWGGSYWMIQSIWGKSRPREAASLAKSTPPAPLEKSAMWPARSSLPRFPWSLKMGSAENTLSAASLASCSSCSSSPSSSSSSEPWFEPPSSSASPMNPSPTCLIRLVLRSTWRERPLRMGHIASLKRSWWKSTELVAEKNTMALVPPASAGIGRPLPRSPPTQARTDVSSASSRSLHGTTQYHWVSVVGTENMLSLLALPDGSCPSAARALAWDPASAQKEPGRRQKSARFCTSEDRVAETRNVCSAAAGASKPPSHSASCAEAVSFL
mmetsp:Transcript_3907/g.11122  ORF Transcript_3907/g.11122 Transcript_3907/m.11122 type:complete len:360 (-) Transcript_3907:342-1421(-)